MEKEKQKKNEYDDDDNESNEKNVTLQHNFQNDLDSLIRVRNRLAHAPDSSLPKIFTGLLPRLLERLERNYSLKNNIHSNNENINNGHGHHHRDLIRRIMDDRTSSRSNHKDETMECTLLLLDKIQTQLTGILSHAVERIRIGCHTIPYNNISSKSSNGNANGDSEQQQQQQQLSSPAPWIHTLLPLLEKDFQCSIATTFLLILLQHSFPRYYDVDNITITTVTTINNPVNNMKESLPDIMFEALTPLLHKVNSFHHKITGMIILRDEGEKKENKIPESLLLSFRTTSWLCLDVLALNWGLPALIDWEHDEFDEYGWSTPCCSTAKEASLEHGPTNKLSFSSVATADYNPDTASSFISNPGSFQLWLDLLLFWPDEQVKPSQRRRRVVRTDAEILVENSTGMTPEGMKRLNYRCKGQSSSWNLRYLRELKLACMHSIIVAPFRALGSNLQRYHLQNNVKLQRHLILCILSASAGSMHGKVALEFVNKIGVQFSIFNNKNNISNSNTKGSRNQLVSATDPWVCDDASLILACSLLTLVLGDEVALPKLDKHLEEKKQIEDILGSFPKSNNVNNDRMDTDHPVADENQNTNNIHFNIFQRAPMPFGVAERVLDFILTRLLPTSTSSVGVKSNMESAISSGPHLSLFVDLVVSLSVSKGTVGSYWAVQCLDGLYGLLSPSHHDSMSVTVTALEHGGYLPEFSSTCLDVASRVLSQIAEVDAETMVTLGEIQHPGEPHPMPPGGVPGPYGGRRDLNVLLAQHRNSQKKRQLRVDCALRARKQAYKIVTEMASTATLSSSAMDIPIILLKCATGEEDTSMHQYVTRALESWLAVFKKSIRTADHEVLRGRVAALLPSLLSAVCSECSIARMAAARWAVDFVQELDPGVTYHVCYFLQDDIDPSVSRVAKNGLNSFEVDSPMKVNPSFNPTIIFFDQSNEGGIAAIKSDLKSRIDRVASSLDLSADVAEVLLGHFQFRVDESIEKYNIDRRSTLKECGVSSRGQQDVTMAEASGLCSPTLCGICYDDVERGELYEMVCGHKFCISCWQSYLRCTMQERPITAIMSTLAILCPQQSCNELVLKQDVQVVAPSLVRQWEEIELNSFINLSDDHSRCPGPDCNFVACIMSPPGLEKNPPLHRLVANCSNCKTKFCFSCGNSPHGPAKCDDFKEWTRIFGSSQFWVKKNAKPCPGCKVPIEKNQGCNHIECSLCGHDFCWLCLKSLRTHMEPHICNRYESHKSAEDDDERRSLFFTDRFKAHDDAEIFAKNEVESFEEKKEKLSVETLWFASDDDLDNMMRAGKTLVEARRFLKNSYVAAWAMRKDLQHRDVFENHQANLELFTEKLSQLLLTKVHQMYAEEGARAIHMHFRAIIFSTASIIKYMERINGFIMDSASS